MSFKEKLAPTQRHIQKKTFSVLSQLIFYFIYVHIILGVTKNASVIVDSLGETG